MGIYYFTYESSVALISALAFTRALERPMFRTCVIRRCVDSTCCNTQCFGKFHKDASSSMLLYVHKDRMDY